MGKTERGDKEKETVRGRQGMERETETGRGRQEEGDRKRETGRGRQGEGDRGIGRPGYRKRETEV